MKKNITYLILLAIALTISAGLTSCNNAVNVISGHSL